MTLNAVCVLAGTLTGIITLTQDNSTSTTTITGSVDGLAVGNHGFHVHEYGDVSASDCTSAGGHYNPAGVNHGAPNAVVRHRGDLGNIVTVYVNDTYNSTEISIVDSQVVLYGEYSVAGRAMVVHQDEDDLGLGGAATSLTTGNAGARLGCCVIGLTVSDDQTTTVTDDGSTVTVNSGGKMSGSFLVLVFSVMLAAGKHLRMF
jgi:Cu-Zn family superoxide dismutase